jgi:predicted TIM-barrel fold metal-dependent hydrolase
MTRLIVTISAAVILAAGTFQAQTTTHQTQQTILREPSTPQQISRAKSYPPLVDHHQHLFSPAMAEFQKIKPITAADVIALLDAAGIRRGVLLSTAYAYSRPGREPANEYEKVREENDWVAAQAEQFPDRLVAFCSVNPLKEYALAEIERCSKRASTSRGIKMHFGNSDVQLENPEHIAKLKAVFRAANDHRMALVIHMRASISKNRPYGAEQARAFLTELMPLATRIVVQVAHLGSAGPGYNDPPADAFMQVLVDAIKQHDKRTRNLWFDLTTNAHPGNPPERARFVAQRIREIGVKHILYGTDAALGDNLVPKDSWAEVCRLDLTDKEIKQIAKNVAPYLK